MAYNHKEIEKKWQDVWEENQLYKTDDSSKKPTYYCLDMFPYPSGAGLHVGHPEGYTATDIVSRYKRMSGFEVLHPMGWDAFGLPAENYAIKTGVHPEESTKKNIETFKKQIQSIGLSYDWTREFSTTDPEYYKWTQWFFLLLYKKGLAYQKKAKVNWCEQCKTVLANEQVENGLCERCKNEVVQKELKQWFFKTTEYAERLLSDLEKLDWPEKLKTMQKNWIGKSEGSEIDFQIKDSEDVISVFTTRADTLFGVSYMVLAPEHKLIKEFQAEIQNFNEVQAYIESTAKKSELERTDLNKNKSGVELQGVTAINPANGKELPVWVADYVLVEYGTGAIMAVPGHDERDHEFAKKYNLEIIEVVEGGKPQEEVYTGEGKLINSEKYNGLNRSEAIQKITKKVDGEPKTTYKLRDWLVSRQRYWGAPIPIIHCEKCGAVPVPEPDLPVLLPKDVDFKPTGESPLNYSEEFHKVSCPECGNKDAKRETDTMDGFVDNSWYYFRYIDNQNEQEFCSKEKMEKWMPVDLYVGGAEHAVGHLIYSRFFTKVLHDDGYISFNEPFKRLVNQGLIMAEDGRKMSKSLGNVINPDDVVTEYGADTLRMYEMFMGPLEDAKPWNTKGIKGIRKFLDKAADLAEDLSEEDSLEETQKILHKTIKKVTEDIESLRFNTAISAMMIFLNQFQKAKIKDRESFKAFLIILAPFAPHLAEELWQKLGNHESVHLQAWPEYKEELTVEDEIEMAIQVNGKTRGKIMISKDATEKYAVKKALQEESVQKHTEDKEIIKTIYVPGRILSLVVK